MTDTIRTAKGRRRAAQRRMGFFDKRVVVVPLGQTFREGREILTPREVKTIRHALS